MAKPSFIDLWTNYPKTDSPCDGPWSNQCAIRMSITLNAEKSIKIDKHTYTEPKCKHEHARGAESLANWLWANHLGYPHHNDAPDKVKKLIRNKQGIVFFKDCFTRQGEFTRRGDHIDLWYNGITKTYSDPGNKASAIWFWELK